MTEVCPGAGRYAEPAELGRGVCRCCGAHVYVDRFDCASTHAPAGAR